MPPRIHSPVTPVQRALFALLDGHFDGLAIEGVEGDVQVYDTVPQDATLPFIGFGFHRWAHARTKTADGWVGTVEIVTWSAYRGKLIMDRIQEEQMQAISDVAEALPIESGWEATVEEIEEMTVDQLQVEATMVVEGIVKPRIRVYRTAP